MIILLVLLAFYFAWNLGANDVANAMGTSVGSKAVTLKQALIIAGILEFTGAVLFGHGVSETLGTQITNTQLFASAPQVLAAGMVSVLIACGLWLQIATNWGLPVSSSHAVVGAIAGFSWVAAGFNAVQWSSLGMISLGWILTPIISAIIAALFYSVIKRWLITQPVPLIQLQEWIPWLSAILISVFGVIVLPPIVSTPLIKSLLPIPSHDIALAVGAIAVVGLTSFSFQQLKISAANHPQSVIERQMAQFQLFSACFVAFAHGSNDVGNAIAPLAVVIYIRTTGTVPLNGLNIPIWILVLGGAGIVAGLAVFGKKVIATIGEGIIPLQPSQGFCAELATASTILLASRLGLPVSTSHALVGAVVGIGIVTDWSSIRWQTLKSIVFAWVTTIPISAGLGAAIFLVFRLGFN